MVLSGQALQEAMARLRAEMETIKSDSKASTERQQGFLGGQTQRQDLSLSVHGFIDVLDVFLAEEEHFLVVEQEHVLFVQEEAFIFVQEQHLVPVQEEDGLLQQEDIVLLLTTQI